MKGLKHPLARSLNLKSRIFNPKAQVKTVTEWRPSVAPPTREEVLEGVEGTGIEKTRRGFTRSGQGKSVNSGMLGARLTTIGDDAINDTTYLNRAKTQTSLQSNLFSPTNVQSDARKGPTKGRYPIGYGTVYKIF